MNNPRFNPIMKFLIDATATVLVAIVFSFLLLSVTLIWKGIITIWGGL